MTTQYKDDIFEVFSSQKDIQSGHYAVPLAFKDFDAHGNPNIAVPGPGEDEEHDEIPGDWVFLADDQDEAERIMAARIHDDDFSSDADIKRGNEVSFGSREFLVLTDDEADKLWDERLESYIDDCLELPPLLADYFDREKWKADARHDGRGHTINSYDGTEDGVTVNGTLYLIYRQN